jgi:hypothetical protein
VSFISEEDERSTNKISAVIVPAAVGSVSGSLFGGKWMQKTGKYYVRTTGFLKFFVLLS